MSNDTYPIKPEATGSIEEFVKLGKYDWANSDISKYPFEPTEARAIELVGFDDLISSEDAIKKLNEQGLRPATATELLLLSAQYPELQRKNYIVALGTVRQVSGFRRVAGLHGDSSYRSLGLPRWGGGWIGCYRFAAVRKSSVALEPEKLGAATSDPLVAAQRLEKGQKVEIRDGKVYKKTEPKLCKECKRPL